MGGGEGKLIKKETENLNSFVTFEKLQQYSSSPPNTNKHTN